MLRVREIFQRTVVGIESSVGAAFYNCSDAPIDRLGPPTEIATQHVPTPVGGAVGNT